MAEKLTVKERIERQIELLVGGITELSGKKIERWDARGNTRDAFSVLIIPDDENNEEAAQGNPGTDTHTLNLNIALCVAQSSSDSESSSFVHNRWLGILEKALTADPALKEDATDYPLAFDVRVTGSDGPLIEQGQSEFYTVLSLEVIYDTYRGDPYSGPAVPEREV